MEKEEEEGIEKSVTEKPGREIWARQSYTRVPTQDTHDRQYSSHKDHMGRKWTCGRFLVKK